RQNDKAKALQQIIENAKRNFSENDNKPIFESWRTIPSSYDMLTTLWLSDAPDADVRYDQQFHQFEAGIKNWREAKARAETHCASEAEQAASTAASDDAQVAASLRD